MSAQMQIAEGITATLPDACTTNWTSAPTKPRVQRTRALHLVRPPPGTGPFKDVYSVMAAWGANHGAVCYGIYAEASSARTSSPWPASALLKKRRIPVCMHNVAADQVYRPSYWNAFGMVSAARPNGRAFDPFQSEHAAKQRTRKARTTGRARRLGRCISS
jgi:L-fucose/D-arabinose isomerase